MLAVPYTPRALTPAWSTWDLHTWLIPITTNTQGLRCGRWGFSAGLLEGKNVIVAFGFVRLTPTEHEALLSLGLPRFSARLAAAMHTADSPTFLRSSGA